MNKMKNQKSTIGLVLVSISLVLLLTAGIFADNETLIPGTPGTPVSGTPGGEAHPSEATVKIDISPVRQVAEDQGDGSGLAYYDLIITDKHSQEIGASELQTYEYTLNFIPGLSNGYGSEEADMSASFHNDNIVTLKAGESVTKEVKVETREEGSQGFIIEIRDEEGDTWFTKGIIVFGESSQPIPSPDYPIPGTPIENRPLFQGTGFMLNEGALEGYRIDLTLLEDEDSFSGKMTIDRKTFFIRGDAVRGLKETVIFQIFEIDNEEHAIGTAPVDVATFSGVIKEFDRFKLLEGKLMGFEDQDWDLTAMSHSRGLIQVSVGQEKKSHYAGAQDVLAVQGESEGKEDVFIKPVKVREKKILGFIPTGKKLVEVEITKGNATFKRKITENDKETIEGYAVSVGSLVDEESIEFSIEETE